jgi:DNA replication protein DnaC
MAKNSLVIHSGICKPDCKHCNGIGFLKPPDDTPIDSPQFGKLEYCPNVDRWNLPGAVRYGLTSDEISDMTWDSIADKESAQSAIDAVNELLERGYGWLYIHGAFGLAKTFILKIAVAQMLRKNTEAAYIRMSQIIDNLRDAFSSNHPSHEVQSRLDWWSQIPILAIDEFDRVRLTEYAQERQFVLMDQRYESALRQETITIMASNKSPSELAEQTDGYLSDRIEDGRFQIIKLDGDSRRSTMGWRK